LHRAAITVSGAIDTSYVEHAYIEPEAGHAYMDGDTLVVVACTQAPHMDRDETAKVLGLAVDKVRIVPTATGGGFGSKLDVSLQPLIGLVALKTGRPAALAYTARIDDASTTKRHPASMQATIGADADGNIRGMIFSGDFNTGAYASWGPTVANRVPVHASGPYATPNYRAEAAPSTRMGRFPAPSAASACRRRRSCRRRSTTNWPASSAWTGSISPEELPSQRLRNSDRAEAGKRASALPNALKRCFRIGHARTAEADAFNLRQHPREARRRPRVLLVWLRQHLAAQSVDNPRRHLARRRGHAAPGRGRYRPGLEHGHRPDLPPTRSACRWNASV
jgi:hypothetical protein